MQLLSIDSLNFYSKYKDWVRKNPQTASEVESTIKWISYFIAGKINKSIILTELVYSASNLLILFNDIIVQSTKNKSESSGNKIKIWLSVIEYSEVFFEISSKSLWGQKGKWIVIISVQLLKCVAKLALLLHYNERIISCPAVMPNKRHTEKGGGICRNSEKIPKINNIAFSLKRSGRIIRKVQSAPPLHSRLWRPPMFMSTDNNLDEKPDKRMLQQHLIGELLYVMKPIVALGAMMKYGQSTWKPWLVSVAADFISLYLLHSKGKSDVRKKCFTSSESLEISRRHLALLLYLMRSPFYENHTRERINSLLSSMSSNIPLARIICKPIQQYLPHWQETYFYLWSS